MYLWELKRSWEQSILQLDSLSNNSGVLFDILYMMYWDTHKDTSTTKKKFEINRDVKESGVKDFSCIDAWITQAKRRQIINEVS